MVVRALVLALIILAGDPAALAVVAPIGLLGVLRRAPRERRASWAAWESSRRVAVITRHLRRRPGTWATIVGTVFAHRLFDVVAATCLVVYILYTSRDP